MAENSSNSVIYLSINKQYQEYLGIIRIWDNLKIAFDTDLIWIKDLTLAQANSKEVKSIPYKNLYYSKENKLFKCNSLLPYITIPSLLWTPVQRALTIDRPRLNHNYFGIEQTITCKLVPSEKGEESCAVLTSLDELENYIQKVSQIRLKFLQWSLFNNKALILGTPILPVQGQTFWLRSSFLIPSGWDLEFPILNSILNKKINPEQKYWILFYGENTYFSIKKEKMKPLTISSLRKTVEK